MTPLKALSQRILIGPMTPVLAGGGKVRASVINQPACLGDYLQHPQIRPFYLHPDLLLDAQLQADPSLRAQLPPGAICYGQHPDDSLAALFERLGDWRPDVLIWWSLQAPLPADIAQAPCATVLLVSDWQFQLSQVEAWAPAFDRVCGDRKLQGLLAARGLTISYWPAYSFDPAQTFETPSPRDIDVGFWGNPDPARYHARNHYLLRLARMHELRVEIGTGQPAQAYRRLLSRSRLAFNHALRSEMNLRAYEAAACGALLMCERDNLEVRAILGDACLYYGRDDFETRIRDQLADEADRSAKARAGQALIRQHNYTRQFEALLALLPKAPSPRRQNPPPALRRKALQLHLSHLPVLQARAIALLEAAGAARPDSQLLSSLAMLRHAYEPLLALPLPWPQSDPGQLMLSLVSASEPVALHNLGWMALQRQHWPLLARAVQGLGQALAAGTPIDTEAPWLPVGLSRLPQLREQVLAETLAPGQQNARQAGLQRLLRWSLAFLCGKLGQAQSQIPAAARAFAAACSEEPGLAEAWFELAQCSYALQQVPETIAALEAGLDQGVFYPQQWLSLIRLLAVSGRLERARAALATARALFAGPAEGFAQLAAELEGALAEGEAWHRAGRTEYEPGSERG